MLTQAQRQENINLIEQLPAQLEFLVAGLKDDQLDTPYGEGKWTIRQVVHHLADSHLVGFTRMRLVLTENEPKLVTYEQELWAKLPDSSALPIAYSLNLLYGLHTRWTFLLKNLREQDWTRKGNHPEWGLLTLDDMLTTYATHGQRHMHSVRNLRDSKGW